MALLEKYVEARQGRGDREAAPVAQQTSRDGRRPTTNGWRCSSRASRRSPPPSSRCARPTPSTRRSSPRPSTARPATCWRRPSAELKQSDFAGRPGERRGREEERRQGDRDLQAALRAGGAGQPEQGARRGAGARGLGHQRHRRPAGAARRPATAGDRRARAVQQAESPSIASGHDGVIDASRRADQRSTRPTRSRSSATRTTVAKPSELLAISAARAQSVYSALASKGGRNATPDGQRPGRGTTRASTTRPDPAAPRTTASRSSFSITQGNGGKVAGVTPLFPCDLPPACCSRSPRDAAADAAVTTAVRSPDASDAVPAGTRRRRRARS